MRQPLASVLGLTASHEATPAVPPPLVSHTSQVQSATFGLPGAGMHGALVQSANCWSQSKNLSCALAMPLEPSNTATKDARKGHTFMSILPGQKRVMFADGAFDPSESFVLLMMLSFERRGSRWLVGIAANGSGYSGLSDKIDYQKQKSGVK